VRGLGGPASSHRATVALAKLDVTGRTFDPTTDGLDLTLRTEGGFVASARIPAGSPGWRTTGDGWRFAGGGGGIAGVTLRRAGTLTARLAGVALDGVVVAPVVAVVARIGDDCWRGELSCEGLRAGTKVTCAKRRRP